MGSTWLKRFFRTLERAEYPENPWNASQWTRFLGDAVDRVSRQMKCRAAMRRATTRGDERSGEYLNIDAIYFDGDAYDAQSKAYAAGYDPFVIPRVLVELENAADDDRVAYSLWKLLCVRAPLRVLISHRPRCQGVEKLREHLDAVILGGCLMKDARENSWYLSEKTRRRRKRSGMSTSRCLSGARDT